MEIIVKGTKDECENAQKSFSELAQLEAMLSPMCQQIMGMSLSCDINNLLSCIRYEPEGGAK